MPTRLRSTAGVVHMPDQRRLQADAYFPPLSRAGVTLKEVWLPGDPNRPVTPKTVEGFALHPDLPGMAAELFGVDAVNYACTSASNVGGRRGDQAIRSLMAKKAGLPINKASTTSSALVSAVFADRRVRKRHGLPPRRVKVASVYGEDVAGYLQRFVAEFEIEVDDDDMKCAGRTDRIWEMDRSERAELIARVADPEALVLVPCTLLHFEEDEIEEYEQAGLAHTLVPANFAGLWALAGSIGPEAVRDCGLGGSLFDLTYEPVRDLATAA